VLRCSGWKVNRFEKGNVSVDIGLHSALGGWIAFGLPELEFYPEMDDAFVVVGKSTGDRSIEYYTLGDHTAPTIPLYNESQLIMHPRDSWEVASHGSKLSLHQITGFGNRTFQLESTNKIIWAYGDRCDDAGACPLTKHINQGATALTWEREETISLNSSDFENRVPLGKDAMLHWSIVDEDSEEVEILVEYIHNSTLGGWIALGIQPEAGYTMFGVKCVIGMSVQHNPGRDADNQVYEYGIEGYRPELIVPMKTLMLTGASFEDKNGTTRVSFRTSGIAGKLFNLSGTDDLVFAYSNVGAFKLQHVEAASLRMVWTSMEETNRGTEYRYKQGFWVVVHVFLMVTGILILFPLGSLIPLLLGSKLDDSKWSQPYHWIQIIAAFLGVFGFLIMVFYESSSKYYNTHGKLGFCLISFVVVQVVWTMLCKPHAEASPKLARCWTGFHQTTAYMILLVAIFSASTGLVLLDSEKGHLFIYAVLGISFTFLVILAKLYYLIRGPCRCMTHDGVVAGSSSPRRRGDPRYVSFGHEADESECISGKIVVPDYCSDDDEFAGKGAKSSSSGYTYTNVELS